MTSLTRRLRQPGPVHPERIESLKGHGRSLTFTLQPGRTLNEAMTEPLLSAGIESGAVVLTGGTVGPITYVRPALSTDEEHAAWYSAPFAPPGETRIEIANVTFGRRDGAPFIHCHGVWIEADGRRGGGHMMPHETVIATPVNARAWGLLDVGIRADPDLETNFTLFHPVTPDTPIRAGEGARMIVARIRPNVDITESLEILCREHGFAAATVRGSIGSLVGAIFEGGVVVEDIATEVLVRQGTIRPDPTGSLRAQIDIALADTAGVIHEGRLVRGQNPVCITFELVLEEDITHPA